MTVISLVRLAVASVLLAGLGHSAGLTGTYNVEFAVEGTPYRGTAKATPGSDGHFDLALTFNDPTTVTASGKGSAPGDSLVFEGTYDDTGRGCTGSMTGRGVIEEKGDRASGTLSLNDSCGGAVSGTFRFWR